MAEEMVIAETVTGRTPTVRSEPSWRALVAAWKASGLSQSQFCRDRGLSRDRFGKWKVKLEGRDRGGGVRLVRLGGLKSRSLREGGATAGIRILVGGRFVVELPGSFEAESLSRVLDVLGSR